MIKNIWAICLIIAMLFTGCTTQLNTETPQVLNFNLGSEPGTLDPQLNKDLYGGSVINNLYEGLFRCVDDVITPAVAKSYSLSADGMTYTFALRKSNWSDGTELTAYDFEFAWKRALDPKLASEYAYQLYYIDGGEAFHKGLGSIDAVGVKAIDANTLEVRLNRPTPFFLELLTTFTYMPTKKEIVENNYDGAWSLNPETSVTNGPFKLEAFTSGSLIKLVKNPEYYNASKVSLDVINIYMINEATTTLTAFESGQMDIIDSVPNVEVPRLLNESNHLKINPMIATAFYAFNVTKAPLDNLNVRKALILSIDRKLLVEEVTKAGELPANGFMPPGLLDAKGKDFNTVAGDYGLGYNPDMARQLLSDAGYLNGKDFPVIELFYNASESNSLIAATLQEMWKNELGITVKLVSQEFAVFQTTKAERQYQIARGSWFGDYSDPLAMLEIWTSDNPINSTGWSNKKYDALIMSAKSKNDASRYNDLYQAESILMSEAPILPLYYYTDLYMVSDAIVGYEKTNTGLWYFGNTKKL